MTSARYLMCPPDFYNIDYSINPWMDKYNRAHDCKFEQWNTLQEKFIELNASLEFITPQEGQPDMVFIDAGILINDTFIPSNFTHPERQGERKFFVDWYKNSGYKILNIPEHLHFEGHGDTLWAGEKKLFFGYGFRSKIESHIEIEKVLKKHNPEIEVVSIELVDPRFYHLDTCFCPLSETKALYFPDAFSDEARKILEKNIELILVPKEEAIKFACNAVVIGKDIIIPSETPYTCDKLTELGYSTHQIEMTEFIKGGGACKCLSMHVPDIEVHTGK